MADPVDALARKTIFAIKPYLPGKAIEEVKRELSLTEVIKLASNENPLGPAKEAVSAARKALLDIHHYPDGACRRLKQVLADKLTITQEQLIVGNGSDEVIKLLGEAFLSPGDEVIVGDPTFSEYEFTARVMGARPVRVPVNDYRLDLEAIQKAVTPKTKLIFICNPNNPTGTIVRENEVRQFLDAIPPNTIVVFDEAYHEYVEDEEYPSTLDFVREGLNVIILRTFSKIYGLAGLRIGYGVARPEVISLMERVREPFNVNRLAQEAAAASLYAHDHVEKSRKNNREGKDILYKGLAKLGLHFVETEANFILVEVGESANEVGKALLSRGIIVRSTHQFGLPHHFRVTIGTKKENRVFLDRLSEILRP